ncbi:unnamed protein product [Clavelina lepadiformis]|uniref:EGF-like domain-containing protein n=1 Tax=Clavelina lepadiformis TaxID=159417 RepID=A0ABP0F031_CLALP
MVRRRRRRRRCDSSPCQWTWGPCSKSCGQGTQSPQVTKPQGSCGSCNLPGPRSCNTQCCPVNCQWGSWSAYGSCSATCGPGTQSRSRSIATPASCSGASCSGTTAESRDCNVQCCPVDCVWGEWGDWGDCSKTCDAGIISRNRPVSIANSCGGEECSGDSSEEKTCNDICCPVDCAWSVWSEWSSCDRDCGGGKHTRNRSIDEISSCGGKTCEGPTEQSEACNEQCCPVDCEVTPWTPWSDCSAECGPNGTSTRDRNILVHSLCGGTPCPDELSEERPCNRFCYNGDVIPTGCSCGSGWRGDCCKEDIDECEEGLAGCHDDAVCVNIPGDFVCKCLPGYTGNGTHCANIDECKLGIHNCDVETTRCVDKKGSFDCDCLGGYIDSKVLCHDMDECSTSLANCSEYATCLNVIGSYKCICDDGFKGDGRVCDDVDECLTPLDECKGNSVCRNTVGGYWCDCGEPYEYNDGECVDRSEGSTFDL